MSFDKEHWLRRHYERGDITDHLVHLTRPQNDTAGACPADTLYKIIKDRKLNGSTTSKGFIVGDRQAVCFQNTPLSGIAQAVYSEVIQYERAMLKGEQGKIRYYGTGVSFKKQLLFLKGARPVIYEKTDVAKKFLPEDEYWRIVRLDLTDADKPIDWTHEREWRIPDSFSFELVETTLIFETTTEFKRFIELAQGESNGAFLEQVDGIVVLDKGVF